MSHELRTPMNGILGYAQLLKRDETLGREQIQSVEAIEHCGDHLLTLINEVLDLAKIETGRVELEVSRFGLDEFLREVVDIARIRATQAGLSFTYESRGPLPRAIESDARKLRQVLINLLANAVKFTERGGVTFRVGGVAAPGGGVRLRLDVEDTGIGIAREDLDKIFEPFHQVHHGSRHLEGTGLGLAICGKLVASMGGTLSVRSEPGTGSTFSVEVDVVAAAEAPETHRRVSRVVGYRGRKLSILVADDKAENRHILGSFLRSLGFEVLEAEDGARAIELAAGAHPDLVFMDLVMPVLDGFEAIRSIRTSTELARIPVIALSESAFDVTRSQSEEAGADGFIAKPVKLDEVIDAVGRHLAIEWTYQGAEAAIRTAARAAPSDDNGVSAPFARELYELAMIGDVRALTARLDELELEGAVSSASAIALRALVRNFDMKGVRRYLEPPGEARA